MKKHKLLFALWVLGTLFILSQCKQNNKEQVDANESQESKVYSEGASIVRQNCISCHSPNEGLSNKIAPSLKAIKEHYLKNGIKEAEFTGKMSKFLLSPSIEDSEMPQAIEKFGLMPNVGFSEEQYKAVATYIYRTKMEGPDWFEKQQQEGIASSKKSEDNKDNYTKKGLNIALSTKAVLGKNLLTAIQKHGTEGALSFCNEKAIPLTDSMAIALKASIKRVSDKNRNPSNAANEKELDYIKQAKLEIQKEGKARPKVFEQNNKIVGYYPIMTNQMCMQCHGDLKTNIELNTQNKIKELYPEDKAFNYMANELRGIWVIEMNK